MTPRSQGYFQLDRGATMNIKSWRSKPECKKKKNKKAKYTHGAVGSFEIQDTHANIYPPSKKEAE